RRAGDGHHGAYRSCHESCREVVRSSFLSARHSRISGVSGPRRQPHGHLRLLGADHRVPEGTHEVARYFQPSIAFLCSEPGAISSNSRRMPLGSITFVSGALVVAARGSSTLTPCWRSAATSAFKSSAHRP